MYTSEKNTKQLTVRGGVNPYGQPDRKISGFFLTASLISHPLMLNITQIDLLIHAKHLITIQMI